MPRPLRIQEAGFVHHVIARGNDQQTLFNDKEDFQAYIDFLEESRKNYPIQIYNFVLMSNHIHLLLEPAQEGNLSKFMEHVSKGYAKYFNKKYKRSGHVFQGRFKSFLIQEERYFFACNRYIDFNPLKARMVRDPKEYPWSGYRSLAFGSDPVIKLNLHSLYENLGKNPGERHIAYRALVSNYQGEDLDLLNRRVCILGDKGFQRSIKNKA